MADHCRQSGRHLRHGPAADRDYQEDDGRRLGHVEQPGNGGPAHADRTRNVGTAGAAAADRARVGTADQTRNDDPEGNAADQIARNDCDGDRN